MTVQELTPTTPETDVAAKEPRTPALDIKQAIQKSTSEVSVQDLQKKGFKQVKVLNKELITRLIHESIDRVLSSRQEEISKEERRRVIEETAAQIKDLSKQKDDLSKKNEDISQQKDRVERSLLERVEDQQAQIVRLTSELAEAKAQTDKVAASHAGDDARILELTESGKRAAETVKEKQAEVEELRRNLADRDRQIEDLQKKLEEASSKAGSPALEGLMLALLEKFSSQQSGQSTQDISKLHESIEGLADKITRIGSMGGGGGGGFDVVSKEVVLERLFSRDGGESMESNVQAVKVKEAKASGVNSSLNKLKALQQGGNKDGE